MIPAAEKGGASAPPTSGSRDKAEALSHALPIIRIRATDAEAWPVLEIETEEELQDLFRDVAGVLMPEDIYSQIFECPEWMLYRQQHLRRALREIEQAIREVRKAALDGKG